MVTILFAAIISISLIFVLIMVKVFASTGEQKNDEIEISVSANDIIIEDAIQSGDIEALSNILDADHSGKKDEIVKEPETKEESQPKEVKKKRKPYKKRPGNKNKNKNGGDELLLS